MKNIFKIIALNMIAAQSFNCIAITNRAITREIQAPMAKMAAIPISFLYERFPRIIDNQYSLQAEADYKAKVGLNLPLNIMSFSLINQLSYEFIYEYQNENNGEYSLENGNFEYSLILMPSKGMNFGIGGSIEIIDNIDGDEFIEENNDYEEEKIFNIGGIAGFFFAQGVFGIGATIRYTTNVFESDEYDIDKLTIRPSINYNLGVSSTYFNYDTEIINTSLTFYDNKQPPEVSSKIDVWRIPAGLGINKVFRSGFRAIKLGIDYYYHIYLIDYSDEDSAINTIDSSEHNRHVVTLKIDFIL